MMMLLQLGYLLQLLLGVLLLQLLLLQRMVLPLLLLLLLESLQPDVG